MLRRWWKRALVLALALFGAIQLVPYGRHHSNPPVTSEPRWDDPQTRALAVRACFDCHSNETKWPWYASVAPLSWLVQRDVEVGRRHLNFSEWEKPQESARDAPEEVLEGEMPLLLYRWTHREGALSLNERQALVSGLRRTLDLAPAVTEQQRSGLERWLRQAGAELQFGIVQSARPRW